jgi:hypothetical protein
MFNRNRIGKIGRDSKRRRAKLSAERNRLIQRLLPTTGQDNAVAFLHHRQRHRAANARSGTRDHRDFSVAAHVMSSASVFYLA